MRFHVPAGSDNEVEAMVRSAGDGGRLPPDWYLTRQARVLSEQQRPRLLLYGYPV